MKYKLGYLINAGKEARYLERNLENFFGFETYSLSYLYKMLKMTGVKNEQDIVHGSGLLFLLWTQLTEHQIGIVHYDYREKSIAWSIFWSSLIDKLKKFDIVYASSQESYDLMKEDLWTSVFLKPELDNSNEDEPYLKHLNNVRLFMDKLYEREDKTMWWDMKTNDGRPMPPGEYVETKGGGDAPTVGWQIPVKKI